MSLVVYCGYNDSIALTEFETSCGDNTLSAETLSFYGSRNDPVQAKMAARVLVEAAKTGDYVVHTINPHIINNVPFGCLRIYVGETLLDVDSEAWRFCGLPNAHLMSPEFRATSLFVGETQ